MKKIILATMVLIMSSCIGGVSKRIPVDEGDTRITMTSTHVIHERCIGCDGFGTPQWELEYIESRGEYDQKCESQQEEKNEDY